MLSLSFFEIPWVKDLIDPNNLCFFVLYNCDMEKSWLFLLLDILQKMNNLCSSYFRNRTRTKAHWASKKSSKICGKKFFVSNSHCFVSTFCLDIWYFWLIFLKNFQSKTLRFVMIEFYENFGLLCEGR